MLEQIRDLLYELAEMCELTNPVLVQVGGAFDRLCIEEMKGAR